MIEKPSVSSPNLRPRHRRAVVGRTCRLPYRAAGGYLIGENDCVLALPQLSPRARYAHPVGRVGVLALALLLVSACGAAAEHVPVG
ncbi:MAG: hypothetical protein QOI10_4192 [Solirubrobacterales bacterium]|jgi:hypothetical protein|nr:hypothetical protein [Solirubrobacterales bacterium]